MLSSFSSNAILAKSRAMYSKRLDARNYTDLLSCKNVGEIASYLKNRTSYSEIFEGVTPSAIHRGQLEALLTKRVFNQYEILCRYEYAIGQDFYKYFITENDVNMILTCVRLINTGNPEDFILYVPIFFGTHTQIDQMKLAKVRTAQDLLNALEGTEYYKALESHIKEFDETVGKLNIEAALNRFRYETLKTIAQKGFKGKTADEVLEVLKIKNDIRTLINIYRLKKYGVDSEIIKQFVIFDISKLSEKMLNKLIDAPTAQDMLKLIIKTDYGRELTDPKYSYIEDAAQQYLYKWNLKKLRYSTNPTVVMFCYIFLLENELSNITHIIEGIRYQVPASEIKKLLIGAED